MDNTDNTKHYRNSDALPVTRLADQAATMMTDRPLIAQTIAAGKMGGLSADFPSSSDLLPRETDESELKVTRPSDNRLNDKQKNDMPPPPYFQYNPTQNSDNVTPGPKK